MDIVDPHFQPVNKHQSSQEGSSQEGSHHFIISSKALQVDLDHHRPK